MTEFDGLYKCLKDAFRQVFSKKKIPFKENFDGLCKDINNRSLHNISILCNKDYIIAVT